MKKNEKSKNFGWQAWAQSMLYKAALQEILIAKASKKRGSNERAAK